MLPAVSVGVTDRMDVSAYASVPYNFDGESGVDGVVGANIKVNVLRTPTTAVSVGVTGTTIYGFTASERPYGGTLYANATFGTAVRNATVGVYGV